MPPAAVDVPPDLVKLGVVRGAYGIKGWARIALLGSDGTVLLAANEWWMLRDGAVGRVVPQGRRRYMTELLAKWPGCDTKEDAEALKGAVFAVPRSAFPAAAPGEYYWMDLVGCQVINRAGEPLGEVAGLRENAGGQWLEVRDLQADSERLIPMVEQYVDAVDPTGRLIRVDWQKDW
jgi:16S rRNA processing protein RimM